MGERFIRGDGVSVGGGGREQKERDRGRSGERKGGKGRDTGAKQGGDRESSPTVCRLLTRGLFSPSD